MWIGKKNTLEEKKPSKDVSFGREHCSDSAGDGKAGGSPGAVESQTGLGWEGI